MVEKLYSEILEDYATLLKWLLGQEILLLSSETKLDMPQYLEHCKALSQILDILERFGEITKKRRDYLEFLSQG